jgi:nicotinamide mononucleotide transporter
MFESVWQQLSATSWIEWLGTLTGITGVYLSIKEKVVAWLLFIVCYAAYVILSYQAELYAAVQMNAVFIIISIYGWLSWSKSTLHSETAVVIARTPKAGRVTALIFIGIGTSGFGWALDTFTLAFMPYLDALAMTCAFTAQWMLSRKYVENWLCWIVADLIYVGLWSAQGYLVSAGLFTLFIGLATRGWWEWQRQLKNTLPNPAQASGVA